MASRYFASGRLKSTTVCMQRLDPMARRSGSRGLNGYGRLCLRRSGHESAGTECYLTVVDSAHNVRTPTLGNGKFLTMFDNAGNTIVRVLGAYNQLNFSTINLSSPPVRSANKFWMRLIKSSLNKGGS